MVVLCSKEAIQIEGEEAGGSGYYDEDEPTLLKTMQQ